MLQPPDLKRILPVSLSNGAVSTTAQVWDILNASYRGQLEKVEQLMSECPELAYAQYNYTPPIHFAVREGHIQLVEYLLERGALDPGYKIYPFQESLVTVAGDRNYHEIVQLLQQYQADPARCKYKGDNGEIHYERTESQLEFQEVVDKEDIDKTRKILEQNPTFAHDETYFWGEGILVFAAKNNNRAMIDLLMSYGARVPDILKWAQFYYFERLDGATYMMEKGMTPNVMSWHHVTLLHDMAQKGDIAKAGLLIQYGADLDLIEEEYQSTPLGMAARWGQTEMVKYLLEQGADPRKSGRDWSAPLAWANKKQHERIEKLLVDAGAG